jgi:hypothetical protein
MRQRSWLAWAGGVLLLTSCSGAPQQDQAQVVPAAPAKSQPLASNGKGQNFANPVVSPTTPISATVSVPAVPGLLQPTNANARLAALTPGRSDPFAALPNGPITLMARAVPRSLPPAPVKPPAAAPLLSGPSSGISTTALPPVLPNAPLGPLPAPLSRTALADAIDITGAVQIGGRWQIIVKESGADTSRRVTVGDALANGKVQIKRVIQGSGGDPIVVLQQDGVEITKSIGAANGPLASR